MRLKENVQPPRMKSASSHIRLTTRIRDSFIIYMNSCWAQSPERRVTPGKLEADDAGLHIMGHAQSILTGKRRAIQNGTAPGWENDISYYPEKVPAEFAKEFRQLRNIGGHVSHKRPSLSLSDFYRKYHKYVHMLYRKGLGHWGLRDKEFPDLREITKFSVLIKKGSTT